MKIVSAVSGGSVAERRRPPSSDTMARADARNAWIARPWSPIDAITGT